MGFLHKKSKKSDINKKILPVIFAVDTSSCMTKNISSVNFAINSIIKSFAEHNTSGNGFSKIEVGILSCSSDAAWRTLGLEDPEKISIKTFKTGGDIDLNVAISELNAQLVPDKLLEQSKIYLDPFICFITCKDSADKFNLRLFGDMNQRFCRAEKVAVVIEGCSDSNDFIRLIGKDNIVELKSAVLLSRVLSGLCSKPDVKISTTPVTIPPVQPRPVAPTEFYTKSTTVKTSPVANRTDSYDPSLPASPVFDDVQNSIAPDPNISYFDSDEFGYSLVLQPPTPTTDNSFDSDSACASCVISDTASPTFDSHGETVYYCTMPNDGYWYDSDIGFPNAWGSDFCDPEYDVSAPISLGGTDLFGAIDETPCPSCGKSVSADCKFCPNCGTLIPKAAPKEAKISEVQFSAVVPKSFIKGEYSMIDIAVYEETYRNIVDNIIANADTAVKEVIGSSKTVEENTMIKIALSSPDLSLDDCEETQKWQGNYLTYSFPIEIPQNYEKKQALFIATVYFNDVIATRLKFIVNCTPENNQKPVITREDILTAFISYASQDRTKVATIIQGMKKARPDMDIFFDVESLRSGDEWAKILMQEIEKRDILFLCWSNYARDSKWVETEWKFALQNKGIEAIEPIPLVSPAECPPPEELSSKHFNDRALLYMD